MKSDRQRILIPNYMQAKALQNLDEMKEKSGLIVMPCGTGKSFMAAMWFKKILEQNPKARLLFLCHSSDILIQANEREFQRHLKKFGLTYGYMMSWKHDNVQVTFATVQSLYRRLKKLSPDLFDFIIVDECHRYQAPTFRKVVKHFKPKFLLGLTATPRRLDGLPLTELFGKVIYEGTFKDAVEQNLLTKINYWCVDNSIDFSSVRFDGHDYDQKDLNKKICIPEYDEAIFEEWKKQSIVHGRKKTVVFCPTVRHALRMEKFFQKKGVKTKSITYANMKHRAGERSRAVSEFRDGKYDVVFVRDMFNEGIDIPDADIILMLRPTQSHTIFTQQLGRGMRKSEGKDYLLVLDFVGNARGCNIVVDVLDNVLGINIEELLRKNKSGGNGLGNLEPLIVKSIGCEVRLSKEKMDVLGKIYSIKLNDRKYREIYEDMKKKLGRVPTTTDVKSSGMNAECFSKKLGLDGKWSSVVKYFGDVPKFEQKHFWRIKRKNVSKEEMIELFNKFYKLYGKVPTVQEFVGLKGTQVKGWDIHIVPSQVTIVKRFGSWKNFVEACGHKCVQYNVHYSKRKRPPYENPKSNTVKIVGNYRPRYDLIPNTNKHVPNHADKHGFGKLNLKRGFKDSLNKSDIRTKILENIKDGDTVLLLESPQLLALKEIQRLGKKPKEIIIPNYIEFQGVSDALKTFETDLNITLIRTSALQYLIDTDVQFTFSWLDFCGSLRNYMKDLEIFFQKQKQSNYLMLTFNLFDLQNKDDAYYFAKVFTFVENTAEMSGRKVKLMTEVCRHYKKMFYNIGFHVTNKEGIQLYCSRAEPDTEGA